MSTLQFPSSPPPIPAQGRQASVSAALPATSIWNREIELGPAFGGKEKQQFFHLLGTLMTAGLSITESLEVIAGQMAKPKQKALVLALMEALARGESLSAAVAQQPQYFEPFEVHSLRMAERAGQMTAILADLSAYHEKRLRLQRKFKQAMSYPVVVITIAMAVLFFMVRYVVPMFSDIFKRFDADLPPITQLVLSVSEFSMTYGWYFIGAMSVLGIGFWRIRRKPAFLRVVATVAVKIPVLGRILLKLELAKFSHSLAVLLRAHVSLDQALELLGEVVRFYPLQATIPAIRQEVVEGGSLYEAMAKHKIYPHVMLQMVRVGEKTAALDKMVGNLARTLEEEGEASVSTLTSLLEPILIVVLGILVGVILVSMYLPMFELSNAIGA